jgi:hypothetical protein
MWTAVEASEYQPLRAEVATILEIMAERHKVDELRAHTIIPVCNYYMAAYLAPDFPSITPSKYVLTD